MPISRFRLRSLLMATAISAFAVVIAGCGSGSGSRYLVNQYTLNSTVAAAAGQVKGITVHGQDVDCPGGVGIKPSFTMTCQITVGCTVEKPVSGPCPVGARGVDSAKVQLMGTDNDQDVVATRITFYKGSRLVGTVSESEIPSTSAAST